MEQDKKHKIEYIIKDINAQGDDDKFIKLGLEMCGASLHEERVLQFGTIVISKYSYLFNEYKVGDVINIDIKVIDKSKASSLR